MRGDWLGAVRQAKDRSRSQLPSVYFSWGRKQELEGNYHGAISAYEKAGVHVKEVPRMLLNAKRQQALEDYVKKTDSMELWLWWGRYCESQSSFDAAFRAYETAKSTLSAVKLRWFLNQTEAAVHLAFESGDPPSLFYLGRQFETMKLFEKAIDFYIHSGRPRQAVRLALVHKKDNKLMEVVQYASDDDLREIARYFHSVGQWEKAARLYGKARSYSLALETCIRGQSIEAFNELLQALQGKDRDLHRTDIEQKIADSLIQLGEIAKAMSVLAAIGQVERALELSQDHDIIIDEQLADDLSGQIQNRDPHERKRLLLLIAKTCKGQGAFSVAAKKFSEAGERLKSVKALIRTGDVDRIAAYAHRSRSEDVCRVAANYLKTLDWAENCELVTKIVSLYTKAGALSQLAQFHEMRGQVEIDEYRDYEKGLDALQQAEKTLVEYPFIEDRHNKLKDLRERMDYILRFIDAREMLNRDPESAVHTCHSLLETYDLEQLNKACLRKGDIFALLTEFHHINGDMHHCGELIREMKAQQLSVPLYINGAILQEVTLQKSDIEVENSSTFKHDRLRYLSSRHSDYIHPSVAAVRTNEFFSNIVISRNHGYLKQLPIT